jgi:hypothetical protein
MMSSRTVESEASLEVAIKLFLDDVASRPAERQTCSCCGNEMEYLETTLMLFGTDSSWNVRVPICRCELNGRSE